jgi:hypothetical protein
MSRRNPRRRPEPPCAGCIEAQTRGLRVESRCVVPFTSFAENEVLPDGSRPPMRSTRPGRSRSSPACGPDGLRYAKVKKGETTNDLFAFLTMSRTLEAGHPGRTAWPVRLATISATRGQCAGDRPFVPRTMGFSVGVGQPCGFSAATKPAQHHRRSEQRPISAAPTIGGFFMTKKPDRSRCSTRCLATISAIISAASWGAIQSDAITLRLFVIGVAGSDLRRASCFCRTWPNRPSSRRFYD